MPLGFGTKNIGIDLGTANTIVYIDGKGIVLREPSVVARKKGTGEVISVGSEARDMIGRTPASIVAIRPMKDGVIADYDTTVAMMKYYMDKALGNNGGKPYVMVCVPVGSPKLKSGPWLTQPGLPGRVMLTLSKNHTLLLLGLACQSWIRPVQWWLILVVGRRTWRRFP